MGSSTDDKSLIERLDLTLTAVLKVLVLGLVSTSVLSLTLCSDDSVKAGRAHVERRLALIGFKPAKFALGGLELQAIAASTTGAEAQNVQGLADELKRLATRGNGGLTDDLKRLAADVDTYSQQLVSRDARVNAQVRQVAQPVATESPPVTAWVYLGRRNAEGRWAPLSDKVTLDDPSRPTRITPVKDVALVERDPAMPGETTGPAEGDRPATLRLLRAGSPPQAVLQLRETDSIGQAKMLWAQVAVAAKDMAEIGAASAR